MKINVFHFFYIYLKLVMKILCKTPVCLKINIFNFICRSVLWSNMPTVPSPTPWRSSPWPWLRTAACPPSTRSPKWRPSRPAPETRHWGSTAVARAPTVRVILTSILIRLNYFILYHAYQLARYKFDFFLFIGFWILLNKVYLRKAILLQYVSRAEPIVAYYYITSIEAR